MGSWQLEKGLAETMDGYALSCLQYQQGVTRVKVMLIAKPQETSRALYGMLDLIPCL